MPAHGSSPADAGSRRLVASATLALLCLAPLTLANDCDHGGGVWVYPHDKTGRELYASPQANPIALTPDGSRVYVANTTSDSVSVIDTATKKVIENHIAVGIDPVAVAVRPDGLEVWVANHISDSVSVIDSNPLSATYHEVIATVQDLDANGVTRFDEPVGIAFASNSKAYVALSSRNEIAIVDVAGQDYTVRAQRLDITAQDPRALTVRGGRLYVVAFESGNQSELSACAAAGPVGDPQCTLGLNDVLGAAANPNLPGIPKNVVRDPDVPDRDLFVFDTTTDTLVGSAVVNVGTLLYGIAVSHTGSQVFVTNTDARNHHLDGNGLAAPPPRGLGLGLEDLENRLFRNRITAIDCSSGSPCQAPSAQDLEEAVGQAVATPLATPYGVDISQDDSVLVVTAAASSRIASVDASNPGLAGVLDTLDVGAIPRGVAFRSAGATGTAYVLNTLGNSVSVVDVGVGGALSLVDTIAVGNDRTPEDVRLGRIAFNDANGSSSGTFACASCHPDAHLDQLLWVIGAQCDDCDQEEPRSTMPMRGLANTIPLHWDGTLGDPFPGPNGETGVNGSSPANCSAGDPHGCFEQLVGASLAGVMCDQPSCPTGPSGDPGELTSDERSNMAAFLANVSYAPARSRPITDTVSTSARDGFRDFFMDVNGGGGGQAQTCADTTGGCHALPLGVATASPAVGAFEAPTMRGMTDRFLQFSGGFTNPEEVLDFVATLGSGVIPWNPADGLDELIVFSAAFPAFNPVYGVLPTDIFQMFEEAGTGTSGATGRQVTLNQHTTTGGNGAATYALLDALELADARGAIGLHGDGVHQGVPVTISYKADIDRYQVGGNQLTRAELETDAEGGDLRATLTAHLPKDVGQPTSPMPLLTVATTGGGATGDPDLPVLPGDNPMQLSGRNVTAAAAILVDGQPVSGSIDCLTGGFAPFCGGANPIVEVTLDAIPANGVHLLQVQNEGGLQSPEVPFCVGSVNGCLN